MHMQFKVLHKSNNQEADGVIVGGKSFESTSDVAPIIFVRDGCDL